MTGMVPARPALSQNEAHNRIRLLRSPNIGPVSYYQLLRRFGDAGRALDALPDLGSTSGRTYRPAKREAVDREISATRASGARYLFHDSPEYPPLLARITGAPPILVVRGDLALAMRPCVALVGARNASAAAVKLAREFSAALAGAGYIVVSGLARGIDAAAHESALPATIGVIASGIDIAYPPEHAALQERIARDALLVAEQPTGARPQGSHFPRRNRIIAGLASGTLVIEAALKSGSLITARLAGEAGREVMAIPGSPLEPRAHGCNKLIREGAALVQSPEEVIELLGGFGGTALQVRDLAAEQWTPADIADKPAADIRSLLAPVPVTIDELIRQSGASAGSVQLALLELELAGLLARHAGNKVSLISP